MKRTLVTAVIASLALAPALIAAPQAPNASVAGTATECTGQAIVNAPAQLRDLTSGRTVGRTTTADDGTLTFTGVPAGRYVVEVLGGTQQVRATSSTVGVSAGAAITDVAVREGNCAAAAGAGTGAVASAGGLTKPAIFGLAAAAGLASIGGITMITNDNDASPSR
jgi:hypothetical protein